MSVVEHRYPERKTNLTTPDVDSNRRTEGLMLREPKLVIKLIQRTTNNITDPQYLRLCENPNSHTLARVAEKGTTL